MPIDGYTTTIHPAKTALEIQGLLAKHGVKSIHIVYDGLGEPSGLYFTISTQWGGRDFSLPIRVEGVLKSLIRDQVSKSYRTEEHARRVAWRVALVWLRAQLALIDAGMTTLPEVMFPFLVTGWDEAADTAVTAFERYSNSQKEIER